MSRDSDHYLNPDEPQSLNQYLYCLSNPLRYTDPYGHEAGSINQKLTAIGIRDTFLGGIKSLYEDIVSGDLRDSLTKQFHDGIEKAGRLGKEAVKTGIQELLHIREYAAGGLKDLSKGMEKVKKETISVQMEKKYGDVRVSAPGYKFQFPTAGAAQVLEEGSPTIIINGRKEESVSDNFVSGNEIATEWIPEVMQIDGNSTEEKKLRQRVNTLNKSAKSNLKLNQDKINEVWEECTEYYEKTGVEVDPRLLLAILFKEGTGSFNTSSTNLAADGQNGINENFSEDVKLATDLVGGKIITYSYYHEDFSNAREDAYNRGDNGIKEYDDILHYINWETPCLYINSEKFESGIYAGDINWNRGVREIYQELAYEGVEDDYGKYADTLNNSNIFNELAKEYNISVGEVVFYSINVDENSTGDFNNQYTIVGEIDE